MRCSTIGQYSETLEQKQRLLQMILFQKSRLSRVPSQQQVQGAGMIRSAPLQTTNIVESLEFFGEIVFE